MIVNIVVQISEIIGSAQDDLVRYYEAGSFPSFPALRINCLPFEGALRYSQELNSISIVNRLGLWALDDANDSNPFCYISKGPCKGAIIKFSHDPEPEIFFSSLLHFYESISALGIEGSDIDELQKESNLAFVFGNHIDELCAEDSDDSTFLITIYLPVCGDLSKLTKQSLLKHSDFYVREALANYIIRKPLVEDLPIAEALAKDSDPQVAKPGGAARSAINKIKWRD